MSVSLFLSLSLSFNLFLYISVCLCLSVSFCLSLSLSVSMSPSVSLISSSPEMHFIHGKSFARLHSVSLSDVNLNPSSPPTGGPSIPVHKKRKRCGAGAACRRTAVCFPLSLPLDAYCSLRLVVHRVTRMLINEICSSSLKIVHRLITLVLS
jgi:hypothetical protein